jgi:cytochrome c oxidase cbb3-type subunit 2
LTGEPLPIAPTDRTALNDPKLEADTPEQAYVPRGDAQRAATSPTALAAGRSASERSPQEQAR